MRHRVAWVRANVVLRDLIRFAYNIYGGDWDIRIDAPESIKTARFDIDASDAGRCANGARAVHAATAARRALCAESAL